MHQPTHDPEKYPTIGPQDEIFIEKGIHKAETQSIHSSASTASSTTGEAIPIVESDFKPTKVLYILRHSLFSKEVSIIDITGQTTVQYAGGEITDEFRDAARGLTEDKARIANPVYQVKRKHWYSGTAVTTSPSSPSPTEELASWKHGAASFSKAEITFPDSSPHSPHPLTLAPIKWYKRTNTFVLNSVLYTYKCDSRLKANRITLLKRVGGRDFVAARYAQRWGSWITGGVLVLDGRVGVDGGVDEVVAVLSTVVMLKRMQQRAAERSKYSGGGGGGGGGE